MDETALSRRQAEALEVLTLCSKNLLLWDQHSRRVRIALLEQLLDARKRYNELNSSRDDAA